MPPNAVEEPISSSEDKKLLQVPSTVDIKNTPNYEESFLTRKDVKWSNVINITVLHAITIYGALTFPYLQHWKTFAWAWIYGNLGGVGVTGGAHRLWSHRAYKANLPLRLILMIGYLSAGQNTVFEWVRDHRIHHKYSETDSDPYNSKRGFFFSHVGWLMLKKHPDVIEKGRKVDMSDITNDPVCAFSIKHYTLLKTIFCFLIPFVVPVYFWNETWYYSAMMVLWRWLFIANATWSVNSFAHTIGYKPYDKKIAPAENMLVSFITQGEGWHNYHHTFPYDYRAAEIGGGRYNLTSIVIYFFAKLGWAYDLKSPSESLIKATIKNRGDGTHPVFEQEIH